MNLTKTEESKKECRRLLREKYSALTEEYRESSNAAILRRVTGSPQFQNAGCLFVYVSMKDEPSTEGIIREAFCLRKKVLVPKCTGPHEMTAAEIRSLEELKPGTFGIPEPMSYETAGMGPDLAVIPCRGAGRDLSRIGRGAGYYDRYLNGRKMYRMCLCFGEMLADTVPHDDGDVMMDCIITENETLIKENT